jgi:anaerobic magnesium-protoporphyrin IX monomethyl ester cyclase
MINKLSEEIIDLMAASGMYQITLSLDSANARTLKELHHKPVNLNSIPGLIKKCRELGVLLMEHWLWACQAKRYKKY